MLIHTQCHQSSPKVLKLYCSVGACHSCGDYSRTLAPASDVNFHIELLKHIWFHNTRFSVEETLRSWSSKAENQRTKVFPWISDPANPPLPHPSFSLNGPLWFAELCVQEILSCLWLSISAAVSRVYPDLTLLDGGWAGTPRVVVLLLCRVVAILGPRVCRRAPLLVAIVTIRCLASHTLRLAELQADLPVLLLHLPNPRLKDGPL